MLTLRVRSMVWFATGMVLTLLATLLVAQEWRANAAPGDSDSTFVPTSPCRLFDYRAAPDTVGPRSAPLGAGEVYIQQVTGSNGDCTGPLAIPSDAVAVALNVTAVNPTAQSNLRVYPADVATVPTVSNLNFSAGQKPVPNKVDVKLSPDGKIKLFNFMGSVSVVGDVVGYYSNSSLKELAAGLETKVPGQLFAPSPVKVTATSAATLADARTDAPETRLFKRGTIEVYAKCLYDTTTSSISGEMYVRTTADGAMMEGDDDLPGDTSSGTEFLNIATPEVDRTLEFEDNSDANTALYDEAEVAITASDGKTYSALTSIGVKLGSPAGGNGPFGPGNICLFGGVIFG